jgi:mRNA interferase RelE/StbE
MRAVLPEPFVTQLAAAPSDVQRVFWKQLRFLLRDLRHPSLEAKKFPESGDPNLWQARITKAWRFYFHIEGDQYIMASATEHPK